MPASGIVVHVHHPIAYRYRPRRARQHRLGFGAGTTAVELREVAERPREAMRVGNSRILAAEGAAWTVLAQDGANVAPADLVAFLERPVPVSPRAGGAMERWSLSSPLCFQDGTGCGRTGNLDPTGAEEVEGAERAARDVTAFLADRVRLHGDRVLVRDERLVGLMDLHRSQPRAVMGAWSRGEGTMSYRYPSLVAVRPDRLGEIWELHARKLKGPVPAGPWDAIAGIPAELRRDDDVAWVANRLPGVLLPSIRDLARSPQHDPDPAALVALLPALEALERRGWTHALSGAEIAPALDTVRQAVSLSIRIEEARPRGAGGGGDRPQLQVERFLLRALDREYMPRLGGRPCDGNDEEALVGLAPR